MHLSSRTSLRRLVATAGLAVVGLAVGVTTASADTTVTEGAMTLTVSQSDNLPLTGGTITVTGSGYDETKGIYVAVCVDNGPGQQPTPCIGGADMTGEGGGSGWISSDPPEYAVGLTTPFGPGGSFELTMQVNAVDPVGGTDCTQVPCAVVTRADHTRTSDRSLDVKVPLTFSATGVLDPVDPAPGSSDPAGSDPVEPAESSEPAASEPVTSAPTETEPEATAPAATAPEATPVGTTAEESAGTQASESAQTEPLMSIQASEVAVDETAATSDASSGWIWWVVGGVVVVVAAGGIVAARQRGQQKAAGHE